MEGTSVLKRLTAFLLVLVLLVSCMQIVQAEKVQTLKKGSRGAAVKTLQTALKDLGFYNGKIDGIFGKGTRSAVKAYQRKNGLKADGVAGPKTLGKLYAKADDDTAETPASGSDSPTAADPAAGLVILPDEVNSFLQSVQRNSGARPDDAV